jgi:hypothetical protein
VDTPLGVPAHIELVQPRGPHGAASVVHSADRLWDALSMLMIVAGTTLFLLARNGLASLANGTQTLPAGVTSHVQRADYFSAQSSLGLLMIGVGVAVGIAAAIRHAIRRRA